MIVNPDKFQLMLLQKSSKKVIEEKLQIDNNEIKSENSVTLLGITIDNPLFNISGKILCRIQNTGREIFNII